MLTFTNMPIGYHAGSVAAQSRNTLSKSPSTLHPHTSTVHTPTVHLSIELAYITLCKVSSDGFFFFSGEAENL